MSYESFAKDDPTQIVIGLFNPELQAVYLFCQISPIEYESHFTSSRKAKREDVLAGAIRLVEWFSENGLVIIGHVTPQNAPLCRFLEDAGLKNAGLKSFSGQSDTDHVSSLHCDTFAEYRSGTGEPP